MPESDEFWNFFWEMRLPGLQDLGKREAILEVSRLIRSLATQPDQPVRLLELGCGEGQIIGPLVEGHTQVRSIQSSVGLDYQRQSLEKGRRDFPGIRFVEADFTDPEQLGSLGEFEIVLLVNALHEVFSAGYSQELGEIDVPAAKQQVEQALAIAAGKVRLGGYLVLFDGLETSDNLEERVRLRFQHRQARDLFNVFAREYRPFRISIQEEGEDGSVVLSRRDFTRYITKSIFLGKRLWQTERLESYQYFNEAEFRAAFASQNLVVRMLRRLTVNEEKWRSQVEIETPGIDFPDEHILILAQKGLPGAAPDPILD